MGEVIFVDFRRKRTTYRTPPETSSCSELSLPERLDRMNSSINRINKLIAELKYGPDEKNTK